MLTTLEIITPAESLALLSAEELRIAAGLAVDDSSQDEALEKLGLQAAEQIATRCGVGTAGSYPPTLLLESLEETFWLGRDERGLQLSRRFVQAVTVTLNDAELSEGTDFIVDGDRGRITRLSNGWPICWTCHSKIVVDYDAGFASDNVPEALKAIAADYVRLLNLRTDLNPLERSISVEGLDSVTYKDGGGADADFWSSADATLERYKMPQQFVF